MLQRWRRSQGEPISHLVIQASNAKLAVRVCAPRKETPVLSMFPLLTSRSVLESSVVTKGTDFRECQRVIITRCNQTSQQSKHPNNPRQHRIPSSDWDSGKTQQLLQGTLEASLQLDDHNGRQRNGSPRIQTDGLPQKGTLDLNWPRAKALPPMPGMCFGGRCWMVRLG